MEAQELKTIPKSLTVSSPNAPSGPFGLYTRPDIECTDTPPSFCEVQRLDNHRAVSSAIRITV